MPQFEFLSRFPRCAHANGKRWKVGNDERSMIGFVVVVEEAVCIARGVSNRIEGQIIKRL